MQIVKAELFMVDLKPKVERRDAIQAFESQETPIVRLTAEDGSSGVGYCYTIGTGGSSVTALLRDHLLPKLMGRDAEMIEQTWHDLLMSTHATSVGAITSLALAAIDTALWDLRCHRLGLPLYKAAGGAKTGLPVYNTEGGWLHLPTEQMVESTVEVKRQGFKGSKIKIGSKEPGTDKKRLEAVRRAVGDDYIIMTDCNQSFTPADAKQRVALLEHLDLAWIEEPFPAHDVASHRRLCAMTTIPVAVGESMYSMQHFKEYLEQGAADIIQVDVARIGGITPWLKVAHMAECFNKTVCPHFLMELHISLSCAIPNSRWLEYIPELDEITTSRLRLEDGWAVPPETPGLGITWDWEAIEGRTLLREVVCR